MATSDLPLGTAALPRWVLLALVPFAGLAGCAIYLRVHWNEIPARFPIHWGMHGPNGWSGKTFLGVYAPLIFGAGLMALLLALGMVGYYGSSRSPQGMTILKVFVAVSWMLGLIFAGVGLLPLGFPVMALVAGVPLLGIGLLAFLAFSASGAAGIEADNTPGECWSLGGIYYNPEDPALFVPKRLGWGYTLNFAHGLSWVILGGLLGGTGLLVAFLRWALRQG